MNETFRIELLRLRNFIPIYNIMDQEELVIDLSNSNKTINVIIGKMGSGKTIILGHLQPFATFGSLDVRNRDDMILPEVDGEKEIIYKKGNTEYRIFHRYIWNKSSSSHNNKSYFQMDGEELNENGNISTFLELVNMHLGIEPNYLRILRLGANVGNVISMKATERKAYIASLLKDADLYLMLFKKFSDDLKSVNAQISVLSNKMHQNGLGKEAEMEDRIADNQDELNELQSMYDQLTAQISELETRTSVELNGRTIPQYMDSYNQLKNQRFSLKEAYQDHVGLLERFQEYPSIDEVSRIIGGLERDLDMLKAGNQDRQNEYERLINENSSLRSQLKLSKDDVQISELQSTYQDLLHQVSQYEGELKGFECKYTSKYLTLLLTELTGVNLLINEISQYDKAIIKKAYMSDGSVKKWAQNQLDMLAGRKHKLQAQLSNIQFSANYTPLATMFLPPFCPTKDCPYYSTHPYTLQKGVSKNTEINADILIAKAQIESVDREMDRLTDLPYVYTKIQALKEIWRKNLPILEELKALRTKDLLKVLTNMFDQVWYDYDQIIHIIEKCEKRNRYYELTDQLASIKSELAVIEIKDDKTISDKIEANSKRATDLLNQMEERDEKYEETKKKLKSYNDIYLELSRQSILEEEKKELARTIDATQRELDSMEVNMERMEERQKEISTLNSSKFEKSSRINALLTENQGLKAKLSDLQWTKEKYQDLMEEQHVLSLLVKASSSKEGIPLKLVQIFLNSCRDILNDLISDVFGDQIEILDFDIGASEFKIPYAVNGVRIDDIEKASQGQQSIISIALSFALIRQCHMDYNIMLLDEVDAPLYQQDREKFITILMKQLQAIGADQVFLISHNNTFDGYPILILMTTDEDVKKTAINEIVRIYNPIAA